MEGRLGRREVRQARGRADYRKGGEWLWRIKIALTPVVTVRFKRAKACPEIIKITALITAQTLERPVRASVNAVIRIAASVSRGMVEKFTIPLHLTLMYPVLLQIGPLTIYSLGVLWALAAFVAAWIARLEFKRHGYDPDLAGSVVTAGAIGGLVGARLLFILEEWESFTRMPFDFIFSGGGFSWYGGLLGGALATAWVFKKHKLPLAEAADIAAPALALGYGIGRIGCFLAGDATWGKVTDLPWAMAFPNAVFGWVDPLTGVPYPPGVKVHPTQLYELIQSLVIFSILWPLRKRDYPAGTIFWLYLILAGSMRFAVEFLRANPVIALGMTEYQWISLILIAVGMCLVYRTTISRAEIHSTNPKRHSGIR